MFANTQMMGMDMGFPDIGGSPMRVLGRMARRTKDPDALRVIEAGLKAMLEESKRTRAYKHDSETAIADLEYLGRVIPPERTAIRTIRRR